MKKSITLRYAVIAGKKRCLVTMIMAFTVLFSLNACKKFVQDPAPVDSLNAQNVYTSNNTAIQVLTGLYQDLSNPSINIVGSANIGNIDIQGSLLSDEIAIYGSYSAADLREVYYSNTLLGGTGGTGTPWAEAYNRVFIINSAIEGLSSSTTLKPAVKQQLLGEAYFMRAFYYFYLVNLYGDVPLALGTDPKVNALLSRSPKADVYAQIVADLIKAQGLLSKNFLDGTVLSTTTERVRPTYWSATALLSRTYLYMRGNDNYAKAINAANDVITNGPFSLTDLNSVFLKNSNETIWSLQPVVGSPIYNTFEGYYFVLPSVGPDIDTHDYYLSSFLYNAFEQGDARKTNWVDSVTVQGVTYPYPYKYKADVNVTSVQEYEVVFRLAEQYLIRAEAEARNGDLTSAINDLNVIRTRARAAATVAVPNPLPNLSGTLSQSQVYAAIEQERRVELFTEWGHRWFDLIRTPGFTDLLSTRADEVMKDVCTAKGGTWAAYKKLYPIPYEQLRYDPNMTHSQNPGY